MAYLYPYGDTQQLNLDWLIEQWNEVKSQIDGSLQAEIDRVEAAITDLLTARDEAVAAQTAAQSSAQAAAGSASTASGAASTATAQAQAAAGSAATAGAHASDAQGYAATAQQEAQAAHNSASAAAVSEGNARNSETAAAGSSSAAAGNALYAEGYAKGTQNGTPVSSGSPYYQNNAKYYSDQAAQEAQDAADSAQDAQDVLDSIPDDYSDLSAEVTAQAGSITQHITWGQGTINATTGEGDGTASTSSTKATRIKSNILYPISEHATINLKSGYKYGVRVYSINGDYIEAVNWSTDPDITFEMDKRYRFIAATSNDTPIKPDEDPFTITFHYANDAQIETQYKARIEVNPVLQAQHSDNPNSKQITLLHYSDLHASLNAIDELTRFYSENSNYITDILNTGDTQYALEDITALGNEVNQFDPTITYTAGQFLKWGDYLYRVRSGQSFSGTFTITKCNYIDSTLYGYVVNDFLTSDFYKKTLYTIGNHDTRIDNYNSDGTITVNYMGLAKNKALAKYFANIAEWNVQQPSNNVLYWYKDYTDAGIRLIGLDVQYWDAAELTWLEATLADAKTNNLAVVIAAHCIPGDITGYQVTNFTNYEMPDATFYYTNHGAYTNGAAVPAIAQFINDGGQFICWLCGHNHRDRIAYSTTLQALTVVQIECAGAYHDNTHNSERKRYDLYSSTSANVIVINPVDHLIKLVRFGNNLDNMMREKNYLCFDYVNRQFITTH